MRHLLVEMPHSPTDLPIAPRILRWIGLLSFGASRDLCAEFRQTNDRCALLDSGLVAPLALNALEVYSVIPMGRGLLAA
jgi:hypothetical protein